MSKKTNAYFSVINHPVSMIPGGFQDLYVEKKDELITTHCTPFAALTAFLDDKATLVQMHMPDKQIKGASKEPQTKQDLKRIKDLKAKLAKIEAKTDDKLPGEITAYTKQLWDHRVRKCPVCDVFHYYEARKG